MTSALTHAESLISQASALAEEELTLRAEMSDAEYESRDLKLREGRRAAIKQRLVHLLSCRESTGVETYVSTQGLDSARS